MGDFARVTTDSEELSDCGAVLDEGEKIDGSDEEFVERVFRATGDEADAVMVKIRGSIDTTRFSTYSSLRNGVLTVQRKDNFCLLTTHQRCKRNAFTGGIGYNYWVGAPLPFLLKCMCVIVSKHRNVEQQCHQRRWEEAVRCSRAKKQFRRMRASCSGRIHFYGAADLADRILMWTQWLTL